MGDAPPFSFLAAILSFGESLFAFSSVETGRPL